MTRSRVIEEGTISARWAGSARALITLDSGEVVEAAGVEELAESFAPGDRAYVQFDARGAVEGWAPKRSPAGHGARCRECGSFWLSSEGDPAGRGETCMQCSGRLDAGR